MSSKLAPHQIVQDVYDEANHSIRTTLQNLEIAIELSADDGDSVEARPPLFAGSATVVSGTPSGTVVAQGDVRYFNEYLVSVNVITTVVATGLKVQIEVSPSDTDEVWHYDSQIIAQLSVPNSGFDHIKASTMGPWRRARAVIIHNGFSAGSFKLYANGR
jgi:hypothetical protein